MVDSQTPDSKNAAGPNAGPNTAAQHLVDAQRLTADKFNPEPNSSLNPF